MASTGPVRHLSFIPRFAVFRAFDVRLFRRIFNYSIIDKINSFRDNNKNQKRQQQKSKERQPRASALCRQSHPKRPSCWFALFIVFSWRFCVCLAVSAVVCFGLMSFSPSQFSISARAMASIGTRNNAHVHAYSKYVCETMPKSPFRSPAKYCKMSMRRRANKM